MSFQSTNKRGSLKSHIREHYSIAQKASASEETLGKDAIRDGRQVQSSESD